MKKFYTLLAAALLTATGVSAADILQGSARSVRSITSLEPQAREAVAPARRAAAAEVSVLPAKRLEAKAHAAAAADVYYGPYLSNSYSIALIQETQSAKGLQTDGISAIVPSTGNEVIISNFLGYGFDVKGTYDPATEELTIPLRS